MSDIKPCPFCGASASIEEIPIDNGNPDIVKFAVGCDSADEVACIGYQSLTTFDRRKDAIEAWNKRAIIEQDNVEPEGYVTDELGVYVSAHYVKLADCFPPLDEPDTKWIPLYLHPPKYSTEPASKDLDELKTLRNLICTVEGLSMTLEYKMGDKKYANRRVFSPMEMHGSPFLDEAIPSHALKLWKEINLMIAAAPTTPKGE